MELKKLYPGMDLLNSPKKFYSFDSIAPNKKSQYVDGKINWISLNLEYNPCFNFLKDAYKQDNKRAFFKLYSKNNKKSENCLILIHGYNGKNKKIYNQLAARFSRKEIDSLVYVLPFHFERSTDDNKIINNLQLSHIFEIYRQSVIELRLLIKYLKEIGYKRVGCLGFSFGGYCCSLLACLEKHIDYIISMASLGDLGPLLGHLKKSFRIDTRNYEDTKQNRLNLFLIENCLDLISPISFEPLLGKNNILFIQGILDYRAPIKDVQKFRKKWDYPKVIWYPCDHFTFILFNRLTIRNAVKFIFQR